MRRPRAVGCARSGTPTGRALLGLTQGNLTIHLQKLEDGAYVAVKKEFVGRKPRTTCKITAVGRKAFHQHLEQLRAIADGEEKFGD